MQIKLQMLAIGILGRSNISAKVIQQMEKKGLFHLIGIHGTNKPGKYYFFDQMNEFLGCSDAVIVTDLAWSDFGTISSLIKNSKHVYLENACLLSNSEIRKIENLATEADVVVQIGLKHRYLKSYQILKNFELKPRIIESNRFIKFNEKTTTISVINDLMMHDIDVVLTLAGSPVKAINATGVGILFDDPDVVNARIEFYNGCIANLAASKISGKDVHKTRFFQNNSYYSLNFLDQSLTTLKNGSETEDFLDNDEKSDKSSPSSVQLVDSSDIFAKELETFYHCIADRAEPEARVTDYLNTKLVADLIVDQLERNFKGK